MAARDDQDLVTLAEVKAWLELPSSPHPDDDVLQALLTAESYGIADYLERQPLMEDEFDEMFNSTGQTKLMLRHFPVTFVTSVTIEGKAVPSVSAGSAASGYFWDSEFVYLRGFMFPRGQQCARIVYTAGFDEQTLPPMIKRCCLGLVALRYRERSHIGQDSVVSPTGQTISYSRKDMPDWVRRGLNEWKQRVPV